jgi:hypothetical protein
MVQKTCLALFLLLLSSGIANLNAQEWRPPSRQMPQMPQVAELSGDWLSPRAAWFGGVRAIAGVEPSQLRSVGEARRGSTQAQVVRFNSGPIPVVVWQDRNGDGVADMIEIFRGGVVVLQVIDADYDGMANVVRSYDANGVLSREDRL